MSGGSGALLFRALWRLPGSGRFMDSSRKEGVCIAFDAPEALSCQLSQNDRSLRTLRQMGSRSRPAARARARSSQTGWRMKLARYSSA
jgi:hypothetical protein